MLLPLSVRAGARRHPLVLIGAGVVLYSTGPVMVQASSTTGPVFSLWRLWLGVGVLAAVTAVAVAAGGARWPGITRDGAWRSWRWSLWAGAAFGVHQLTFFTAVKATSVTDVALMNTLAPIVIAVAAAQMFGERAGARFRAWTVVAIAGAAIVVLGASTGPEGHPVGMVLAVANVGFFSAFFLLSKRGRDEIDVLPFLLGVMVVATVVVAAWCFTTGEPVGAVDGRDVLLALALAAGPGTLGHFVMTWPLRWVAANVPPVMRLAQPVIAGALAWALLAEPVTLAHVGGGALTLLGVWGALMSPAGRAFATSARPEATHRPGVSSRRHSR